MDNVKWCWIRAVRRFGVCAWLVLLTSACGNDPPHHIAGDTVAPVITLVGANQVNVPQNTPYVDMGANAVDDVDGDITTAITIMNPVNVAIVGPYTVTYNVS